MKPLIALGSLLALALASIVFAQSSGQGVVRTPQGDRPFTYVEQAGQIYVSAEEVATALGGSIAQEANGYKVTIGSSTAGFGTDSRYGVIRDDLIEMPVAPITIEGRPFVPWQFFRGFLATASSLDVIWDAAGNALVVRPQQQDAVPVEVSVANLQAMTKMVLTLGAPVEYAISQDGASYTIRFRTPIRPPFPEQAYEDPNIARLIFTADALQIRLTEADVIGDAYSLENPPRIVVDFRKGVAAAPGAIVPQPAAPRVDQPGIRTIVIDPGHGGKEVGAVGPTGLMEKDVTLALSRKLAAALSRRTGARVILTRDDDSLVSLDQRTALANQYAADLFLSVHMNAAVVQNAQGSETYFLSLEASDELARKAAELENASGGRGSSSDLNLILWDLAQQAYLDESSRFARSIQESMNAATGVANRGVKQAPFKVLIGATMPAALVEVGFISNPQEESKLQSGEFQNLMVEALTSAVERYKLDYETRIGLVRPEAPASAPAPAARRAPQTATPAAPQTRTEQE